MIQIEQLSCENKRHAESIEHKWIESLSSVATLNTNMPYAKYAENPQLYKQSWYEARKPEILEKSKENYEQNKDVIKIKVKEYAEENKEKISAYQKQYAEENKEKLSAQKKIYREEHKEEAALANKEWREKNKDIIKNQIFESIQCECGNTYSTRNKYRHFQSKTHVNYQNKLDGIICVDVKPKKTDEEKLEQLKQCQKKYKELNADKIKEGKQIYREKNAAKISESCKKYREEHKDEIYEQNQKYSEENADKIKKNKAEWYRQNKEVLLEKMKQTYTCECGSVVRCTGKIEHNKSNKHQQFIK